MVKITSLFLPFLVVGNAYAFAPIQNKAFVSQLNAEEKGGALVPVNEETVEFTAGLVGGAAGFVIGGPVVGAITAAAANYVAKSDLEVTEAVQDVSKAAINVYNYLAELDGKYKLLKNAQTSLENTLEKVKANDQVNAETVEKVEEALAKTTAKIDELNQEYDFVGGTTTALGVVGDLVEKAVIKVGELNEQYELSDKALTAMNNAIEKAKAQTNKA